MEVAGDIRALVGKNVDRGMRTLRINSNIVGGWVKIRVYLYGFGEITGFGGNLHWGWLWAWLGRGIETGSGTAGGAI